MHKMTFGIVGAVATLAFAVPAAAQSYGRPGHHAQVHDQLEAQHEDGHDQLDEEHAEAHEWGLTHSPCSDRVSLGTTRRSPEHTSWWRDQPV